jgi:hypothetical protein
MGQTQEFPILGQVRLQITYDAGSASDWLQALEARLQHPQPLWTGVGAVLRAGFRENFAVGGRPSWHPLAPSTIGQKAHFLQGKPTPPYTAAGKTPRRLLQNGSFGAHTLLIRRGKLRDSWGQKGAEGQVEAVDATGRQFFIGSQLTETRNLAPTQPVKHYHLLTKKALKARKQGQVVPVQVPLARFHQEGTKFMVARPNLYTETELTGIEHVTTRWVLGE